MSIVRVDMFDSQGFAKVDGYCLYAAFAPTGQNQTFIKIGISEMPLRRVYEVHCGSPEPIEAMLWTHVGAKRAALSAERTMHERLKEYRTRGEWFLMRMDDPAQKAVFHATTKASFAMATGRQLKWRKLLMADVIQSLGIDPKGLALKRKMG